MLLGGSLWFLFWGFVALYSGLGWGVGHVFGGPPSEVGLPPKPGALVFFGLIASVGLLPIYLGAANLLGIDPRVEPRFPKMRWWMWPFATLAVGALFVLAIAS